MPWFPTSAEEKEQVRHQLNRLLETSHFKNSRRYPALFRFIVEETLEGRGEFLKERLLGVHVFDRPADYDTAADPIVRVTVAEIRKRIAQYYHEEAHDSEMRIEMTPGRYAAEFHRRREVDSSGHFVTEAPEESSPKALYTAIESLVSTSTTVSAPPAASHRVSRRTRYILAAVSASLVALLCLATWRWTHPSAIDLLWGPILDTRTPVTFCLPMPDVGKFSIADTKPKADPLPLSAGGVASSTSRVSTFLGHESLGENVVFSDVLAMTKISDLLATKNRASKPRLSVLTKLDDLRQGPAVLIGGLDNPWSMRALASLRYHFGGEGDERYWITDAKYPEKRDWMLDLTTQYGAVTHDYALIARIHDESTGQIEMIVAGIGMSGTAAAGEFLTDPRQVELLRRKVGAGFKDHDFEAVLGTDVVDGTAGPPKIIAAEAW
jgi:hypothetical protein